MKKYKKWLYTILIVLLAGCNLLQSPPSSTPVSKPTQGSVTGTSTPVITKTLTPQPSLTQTSTATPTQETVKFSASVTINDTPVKTGWLLRANVFILDQELINQIKEGKYVTVVIKSESRQQLKLIVEEGGQMVINGFVLDYHETLNFTCRIDLGDKTGLKIYIKP